jgi:hypothetical protein
MKINRVGFARHCNQASAVRGQPQPFAACSNFRNFKVIVYGAA